MRRVSILFHVTAALVFIQLVLGGLLVFGYTETGSHLVFGFVVGVFVLASLIVSLIIKPHYRALELSSILLFVLMVIQGVLGFMSLDNSNVVIMHYINAVVIFGVAIAVAFFAMRWSRMSTTTAVPRVATSATPAPGPTASR